MYDVNILIDYLPETVTVSGKAYKINSNFRTAILFEMLMQEAKADEKEKAIGALQLWYPEIPEDIRAAIDRLIWFYTCGKRNTVSETGKKSEAGFTRRIYDFDIDAQLIYAAFLAQYRIDLQDTEYLHWWKFAALFGGLNEENEICKIMQYRAIDLNAIKNKDEKKYYAKLQAKYRLPDNRSKLEKEALTGALFAGCFAQK